MSTKIAERILDALRKDSPLAPGALVKAVQSTPSTVRQIVSVLEVQGKVTKTGTGPRNTLIHLGRAPASDQGRPRASRREASAPQSSDRPAVHPDVERRDQAVWSKLAEAGRAGRSLRELCLSFPEESESALTASLTRLRILKRVTDEDGRWRLAS